MKPVKQTKLWTADGIHNGNCLAACLASLLDLPLWMVPPFEDMFGRGDHISRMVIWLERMFSMELEYADGHPAEGLPEFYMATGLSPRGVLHAVIYSNGRMVHDPHFSDGGIAEVQYVQYLMPVERVPC